MPDAFEVRDPEIEKLLRAIGSVLKDQMRPGWGFTLMIFEYGVGDGEGMFYISSAKREDMVKAMKEFIERQEA